MRNIFRMLKGFYDPLDSIEIVGGLALFSLLGYGLWVTLVAVVERFMS